MKVLDAGCGTGVVTKAMYKVIQKRKMSGALFHAFDFTQAMLDLFKLWIGKNHPSGIELNKVDVLNLDQLPHNWSDYDLIVSSAMLEHLDKSEISDALSNLRKLLKKDGVILVFITKQGFIMRWLVHVWWKANMYKEDEIRTVFQKAGYSSVRLKRFPFPYNYVNIWGHVIEARV